MTPGTPGSTGAAVSVESPAIAERDPFEARFALQASGMLRQFNEAGVIAAADVHVARRLGQLGGEADESVLLATALAVRGPRLGHVHVDLAEIRHTAAVDAEEQIDVGALDWPEADAWIARVSASPLVALGDANAPGQGGVARPLRLVGSWLYLDRYWAEEVGVARALREMASAPLPGPDPELLRDGLARLFGPGAPDRQRLAAETAVTCRWSVVAGGPGTGKTTTVARIVALIFEQAAASHDRFPLVALAAPTGKAAARLQEAVHSQAAQLAVDDRVREELLSLRASTIHRLLGWRPGSSSRFRHDRNQRLAHDVVVVDETSMVSLSLMARLIEALRSGARLILVGDPGQLASIEAGAVLGDIVGPGAGAPAEARRGAPAEGASRGGGAGPQIVVLDRVHRFGGGIARLATAIRAGDGDGVIDLLRAGSTDVTWLEVDVAEHDALPIVSVPALAAARRTVQAARAGRAREALEALGSFRILCAHRRGPYGVATWTARMEAWLAAELPELDPEDRWYIGRPLLVNENDYELRLNNGDTGVVVATGTGRVAAAFARGAETITHAPSRLSAVDTVYAMTVHKSQGSQFGAAAVLLPGPDSRILTRELLYTAATRAQKRLILAGTEESVRAAVARPVARASGLGRRLWGDLAA
ncbi:MAG: exodeoxyribonuclease V subunit alpha [Solirubrobacteraceae bacterium]